MRHLVGPRGIGECRRGRSNSIWAVTHELCFGARGHVGPASRLARGLVRAKACKPGSWFRERLGSDRVAVAVDPLAAIVLLFLLPSRV